MSLYEAIRQRSNLYTFNSGLLDFGLRITERLDSDCRCLYEVHEDTAYVLLFLHREQDVLSALYRQQILRDP